MTRRVSGSRDDARVKSRGAARWIVAALVLAALVAVGRVVPFREWLDAFGHWITGLGPIGLVLYAAAHVLVSVLMMPAVLMTIGAGFFFGPVVGMATALTGATAGAAAAFLIARSVARERVARAAGGDARYAALDRAIGEKGWRIVFLLRLSALVPFVLSNYAYGLTAIRFWPYVAATAAGMAPLTFLYVSLGVAAHRLGLSPEADPPGGAWTIWVLAAGLVITVGVTIYVARLTKAAMGTGKSSSASSVRLPPSP
jgi:uncharacterized membrane protein YdjX (TVP38/TMEM64 family)